VTRAIALFLAGLVAALTGVAATPHKPFTVKASEEALGAPVHALDGTIGLHFLPNNDFSIGVVLSSTSRKAIVVTDVRTVGPPSSLVRQIGTMLHSYNPPPCPAGGSHAAPPSKIAIDFHLPGGPAVRQTVSLDVSRPAFESPPRCRVR